MYEGFIRRVDSLVWSLLCDENDSLGLRELLRYSVFSGGKRIRPLLAMLCCRVVGGSDEDVLYAAAGIELLHNYSLIIDDIIDRSVLRRGRPTVWKKFGVSVAQCVAADLAASAFRAAALSKHPVKVVEIFARVMKRAARGEMLDILFEQSGRENESYVVENRFNQVTLDDYFQMVSNKTAAFIEATCEIGGVCADASEEEIEALRRYGYNIGVAFQIRDDILDIFGKAEVTGEEIGKDLRTRKLGNLVILLACEEMMNEDKRRFLSLMRKNEELTNYELNELIKMVKKTNAEERAMGYGRNFVDNALCALRSLPQNEHVKQLEQIAFFILRREK